jgi:hypothetical protein
VLVIRAWREEGPESDRLHARLTQTGDATVPGWQASVASNEKEILAAVRLWLEAFSAET